MTYEKIIKKQEIFSKEAPEPYSADKKDKIKKAEEAALKIKKDAEEKAKEILAQAEKKIFQEQEKAIRLGYQEGLQQASNYIIKAKLYYENQIKKYEKEIIELAVSIARKILNANLSLDKEMIVKIAKQVINEAKDQKEIILKVNPEDWQIIKAKQQELIMIMDKTSVLKIMPEEKIKKGSCILETEIGKIEGKIESQLKAIYELLMKV